VVAYRPFLPPTFLSSAPCARKKGEAYEAGVFGCLAFGFFFNSRLPRCSRFAMLFPFVDPDYSQLSVLLESRAKSSSTLAISFCLRASCAIGVPANKPSR
jgi:hypothetical protein